jgi:hypothetical protein
MFGEQPRSGLTILLYIPPPHCSPHQQFTRIIFGIFKITKAVGEVKGEVRAVRVLSRNQFEQLLQGRSVPQTVNVHEVTARAPVFDGGELHQPDVCQPGDGNVPPVDGRFEKGRMLINEADFNAHDG